MSQYGRQWLDHHIAAGYHEQDWGPVPTDESELLGTYQANGDTITVRLVQGESGVAEFELDWENGPTITVLNEETALLYLIRDGAAEFVPDE